MKWVMPGNRPGPGGDSYYVAKNQRVPKSSGSSGKTAAQRRLEAQRAVAAASAKASARRRKRMLVFVAPLAFLLVVVLVLVLVSVSGGDGKKPGNSVAPIAQDVATQVASVPAAVLDEVKAGGSASPPKAGGGGVLTGDGGKPRILYVGAEWCPFCAAERWPLVVALSRFGTFTGLGITESDPNDVHPNTPTLSFSGSTYTSDYLVFDGVELQDGDHKALDTLSASDQQLFRSITGGNFPFVDIGGKYVVGGAQFDPDVLKGKTHAEIAAALSDPKSQIAQDVDGSANVLTATICKSTDNKPADVCTSAGVTAAAGSLG